MAYRQPIAVRAGVFRLANDYLVGGNKAAAQNLLYSRGLTWGDMLDWQRANVKLQRAPREMSLPDGLRGLGFSFGKSFRRATGVLKKVSPTARIASLAQRKIPAFGRATGAAVRRPSAQTYPQSVLSQYVAPIYYGVSSMRTKNGFFGTIKKKYYRDANGKEMIPSTYSQWLQEGGAEAIPFKDMLQPIHYSPPLIGWPPPQAVPLIPTPSPYLRPVLPGTSVNTDWAALKVTDPTLWSAMQGTTSASAQRVDGLGRVLRSSRSMVINRRSGVEGMGAGAPAAPVEASAATLAPPGSVILSPDLAIDWKGGNVYYQKMKLGIIASLLTGMVVKGIMFGGGKVSSAVRSRFGKKAVA